MAENSEIPEDAVDVGGGVYVVRGGYKNLGLDTLRLPTVRGADENLIQDEEQDQALIVQQVKFTNGSATVGEAKQTKFTQEVEQTEEEVRKDQFVRDKLVREEETSSVNPEVDSVGSPVSEIPNEGTEQTKKHGCIEPTPKIGVSLEHQSGFAITMPWDLVVVTEPLGGVTTVVLGLDPIQTLRIPSGSYRLEVGSDTYNVVFGNQTFIHNLRYYIFLIEEEEEEED